MKFPTKLTDEEWNLLVVLTTYNHMDCWFDLRTDTFGNDTIDYVYDLENDIDMSLHDAIDQVADGLCYEDLNRSKNGVKIWNGLMDKFNLKNYKVC